MMTGTPSAYLTPCPVTPVQAQALERFCRAIQTAVQGGAPVAPVVAVAALEVFGNLTRSPGGASVSAGWSALRSPTLPQTGAFLLMRNTAGDELHLQLDYAGKAHIGSWTLYGAGRMIEQVAVFDLVQRGAGWTLRLLNREGQAMEHALGTAVPGGLIWTRQPEYPKDRDAMETPGPGGGAFAFNPAEFVVQVLEAVAGAAAAISQSAPPVASEPEAATPTIRAAPALAPANTGIVGRSGSVSGKLVVQNGPLANQAFPLGQSLRLGRGTDNDLALPDSKASRHHAIIERKGEHYQITDLGSSNGTLVNGRRIAAPTTLANGDRMLIGDTQLLFYVQS